MKKMKTYWIKPIRKNRHLKCKAEKMFYIKMMKKEIAKNMIIYYDVQAHALLLEALATSLLYTILR